MFRSLNDSRPLVASTAILGMFFFCLDARAQTFNWQGGAGSNDWSIAENWQGHVAPLSTTNSTLLFGATSAPFPYMSGNYTVASLVFTTDANAYTIDSTSGSTLTLGANGITQNSNNRQLVRVSNIALAANQTWSISGSGGLFVTAPITGDSGATLTKAGSGTLTLLGNNVYRGGTIVSGGVLHIGGDDGTGTIRSGRPGTGPVTIGSGSAVNFNASSTTGSIAITNDYGGLLNFNDNSNANSATITNQGNLFFKEASTGGSALTIANNAGSLNISGPSVFEVGALSGAGDVRLGSAELIVGKQNTAAAISGTISGTGSLTKLGMETLTLTGVNTQTGGVTVKNGLVVLNGGASGGAGAVRVSGGTAINPFFPPIIPAANAAMTVSAVNALSQASSISIEGGFGGLLEGGTATVEINAPNALKKGTQVSVTGGGGNGRTGVEGGSASLILSVPSALTNTGTVSVTGGMGAGAAVGGSALLAVSATNVIGNLGTIVLSGGSSDSVSGGVGGIAFLALGVDDTAMSNTTHIVLRSDSNARVFMELNGYDLTIGGIDTQGVVNNNLIVQNGFHGRSTLTVGTDNVDYNFGGSLRDGTIRAKFALVKVGNGTLTLSGTSYHTGGTTLNGGTLLIASNTSVPLDEIVLNSGFLGFVSGNNTLARSFTINQSESGFTAVNAGDILTVSGNITGSGTLNKQGNGTLILTGTNTFTGGLNIRSGNLEVAAVSALGSGVITNDGALTFRTNSDTSLDSVITGSGTLTKAGSGTLLLTGNNSYTGGTSIQGSVLAVGNDHALGKGTVTLSGSTLRASGDARKLNNAVTIASPSTLSSGNVSTANPQTPGLMLTGGVTLASDGPLTVTGNTRVAITGVLSEDGIGRTLIKDGAGTLVLTNDNTYTGGTFVRAGTLVVNNAYNRVARGSGTGEGAVTVGRGATLTGTFAISGAVQVNSGGTLGIGNSIGTSSVSTLTLAGGSLLQFEIGDDGISSDRLDVTGLLTKSGSGPITFLLSGEQQADGSQKALSEGTFTLLTFSAVSGLSVNDFAAAGLTTDWASRFTFTGPTWDNGGMKPGTLVVTLSHTPAALAAPEPTSLLFLLATGGLGGIPIACRRGKGRAGAIA